MRNSLYTYACSRFIVSTTFLLTFRRVIATTNRVTKKSKPLPNYRKIVLNRIKACQ